MKKAFLLAFCLFAQLNGEVKVLAFAGSTRQDSYNKKLLAEAVGIARQEGASVKWIDLKDYSMPFYDADLESKEGVPQKAKDFRQLMLDSQVIFIASPEYNGAIPGLLKNTLDWASRNNGDAARDAFKGKKFVLMSASPGASGGAKGLDQLKSLIEYIGGTVVAGQVVVPEASNAFDEEGHLKNPKIKAQLQQLIQSSL